MHILKTDQKYVLYDYSKGFILLTSSSNSAGKKKKKRKEMITAGHT